MRRGAILVLIAALVLAACGGDDGGESFDPAPGSRLEPPKDLLDFTLTDHTGEPFHLSDLRGQVALIYFGYTFCPDVCPTNMANYLRVVRELGEDAGDVAVVFISVDGERDTPAVLNRYVTAFHPDFIGLTGDEAALQPVTADFGVFYQRTYPEDSAADYLVSHTDKTFIVGPEGRLHLLYPGNTDSATLADAVRWLLAES